MLQEPQACHVRKGQVGWSWQEGLESEKMFCPPLYCLLRWCRKESGGAKLGQLHSHQKSTSSFLGGLDREGLERKHSLKSAVWWWSPHGHASSSTAKLPKARRKHFTLAIGSILALEGKRNVLGSCSFPICLLWLPVKKSKYLALVSNDREHLFLHCRKQTTFCLYTQCAEYPTCRLLC